MTIKASKCHSFDICKKGTTSTQYKPKLYLDDGLVPPVKLDDCFTYLQPFTKYLRLTLVCEITDYVKSLISVLQVFFASIDNIFILTGRLGTRLSFYEI